MCRWHITPNLRRKITALQPFSPLYIRPRPHAPARPAAHLDVERVHDIVLEELKVGVAEPVLNVLATASEQIVQDVHDMALQAPQTSHQPCNDDVGNITPAFHDINPLLRANYQLSTK